MSIQNVSSYSSPRFPSISSSYKFLFLTNLPIHLNKFLPSLGIPCGSAISHPPFKKLDSYLIRCFPLCLLILQSIGRQIPQVIFPHCSFSEFRMVLSDSKYKCAFCFNLPRKFLVTSRFSQWYYQYPSVDPNYVTSTHFICKHIVQR